MQLKITLVQGRSRNNFSSGFHDLTSTGTQLNLLGKEEFSPQQVLNINKYLLAIHSMYLPLLHFQEYSLVLLMVLTFYNWIGLLKVSLLAVYRASSEIVRANAKQGAFQVRPKMISGSTVLYVYGVFSYRIFHFYGKHNCNNLYCFE